MAGLQPQNISITSSRLPPGSPGGPVSRKEKDTCVFCKRHAQPSAADPHAPVFAFFSLVDCRHYACQPCALVNCDNAGRFIECPQCHCISRLAQSGRKRTASQRAGGEWRVPIDDGVSSVGSRRSAAGSAESRRRRHAHSAAGRVTPRSALKGSAGADGSTSPSRRRGTVQFPSDPNANSDGERSTSPLTQDAVDALPVDPALAHRRREPPADRKTPAPAPPSIGLYSLAPPAAVTHDAAAASTEAERQRARKARKDRSHSEPAPQRTRQLLEPSPAFPQPPPLRLHTLEEDETEAAARAQAAVAAPATAAAEGEQETGEGAAATADAPGDEEQQQRAQQQKEAREALVKQCAADEVEAREAIVHAEDAHIRAVRGAAEEEWVELHASRPLHDEFEISPHTPGGALANAANTTTATEASEQVSVTSDDDSLRYSAGKAGAAGAGGGRSSRSSRRRPSAPSSELRPPHTDANSLSNASVSASALLSAELGATTATTLTAPAPVESRPAAVVAGPSPADMERQHEQLAEREGMERDGIADAEAIIRQQYSSVAQQLADTAALHGARAAEEAARAAAAAAAATAAAFECARDALSDDMRSSRQAIITEEASERQWVVARECVDRVHAAAAEADRLGDERAVQRQLREQAQLAHELEALAAQQEPYERRRVADLEARAWSMLALEGQLVPTHEDAAERLRAAVARRESELADEVHHAQRARDKHRALDDLLLDEDDDRHDLRERERRDRRQLRGLETAEQFDLQARLASAMRAARSSASPIRTAADGVAESPPAGTEASTVSEAPTQDPRAAASLQEHTGQRHAVDGSSGDGVGPIVLSGRGNHSHSSANSGLTPVSGSGTPTPWALTDPEVLRLLRERELAREMEILDAQTRLQEAERLLAEEARHRARAEADRAAAEHEATLLVREAEQRAEEKIRSARELAERELMERLQSERRVTAQRAEQDAALRALEEDGRQALLEAKLQAAERAVEDAQRRAEAEVARAREAAEDAAAAETARVERQARAREAAIEEQQRAELAMHAAERARDREEAEQRLRLIEARAEEALRAAREEARDAAEQAQARWEEMAARQEARAAEVREAQAALTQARQEARAFASSRVSSRSTPMPASGSSHPSGSAVVGVAAAAAAAPPTDATVTGLCPPVVEGVGSLADARDGRQVAPQSASATQQQQQRSQSAAAAAPFFAAPSLQPLGHQDGAAVLTSELLRAAIREAVTEILSARQAARQLREDATSEVVGSAHRYRRRRIERDRAADDLLEAQSSVSGGSFGLASSAHPARVRQAETAHPNESCDSSDPSSSRYFDSIEAPFLVAARHSPHALPHSHRHQQRQQSQHYREEPEAGHGRARRALFPAGGRTASAAAGGRRGPAFDNDHELGYPLRSSTSGVVPLTHRRRVSTCITRYAAAHRYFDEQDDADSQSRRRGRAEPRGAAALSEPAWDDSPPQRRSRTLDADDAVGDDLRAAHRPLLSAHSIAAAHPSATRLDAGTSPIFSAPAVEAGAIGQAARGASSQPAHRPRSPLLHEKTTSTAGAGFSTPTDTPKRSAAAAAEAEAERTPQGQPASAAASARDNASVACPAAGASAATVDGATAAANNNNNSSSSNDPLGGKEADAEAKKDAEAGSPQEPRTEKKSYAPFFVPLGPDPEPTRAKPPTPNNYVPNKFASTGGRDPRRSAAGWKAAPADLSAVLLKTAAAADGRNARAGARINPQERRRLLRNAYVRQRAAPAATSADAPGGTFSMEQLAAAWDAVHKPPRDSHKPSAHESGAPDNDDDYADDGTRRGTRTPPPLPNARQHAQPSSVSRRRDSRRYQDADAEAEAEILDAAAGPARGRAPRARRDDYDDNDDDDDVVAPWSRHERHASAHARERVPAPPPPTRHINTAETYAADELIWSAHYDREGATYAPASSRAPAAAARRYPSPPSRTRLAEYVTDEFNDDDDDDDGEDGDTLREQPCWRCGPRDPVPRRRSPAAYYSSGMVTTPELARYGHRGGSGTAHVRMPAPPPKQQHQHQQPSSHAEARARYGGAAASSTEFAEMGRSGAPTLEELDRRLRQLRQLDRRAGSGRSGRVPPTQGFDPTITVTLALPSASASARGPAHRSRSSGHARASQQRQHPAASPPWWTELNSGAARPPWNMRQPHSIVYQPAQKTGPL